MGCCVSVNEIPSPSSGYTKNKVLIPSSENKSTSQSSTSPPETNSHEAGSEEKETFDIDSCQDQIESDSENEFFSVRGDFSRSSSTASGCEGSFKVSPRDCKQEPSKLAELFSDRFWIDQLVDYHKDEIGSILSRTIIIGKKKFLPVFQVAQVHHA